MSNQLKEFMDAVKNNDLVTLQDLEREHISLESKNNYALRWASYYNHTDMVLYLLDNIPNIKFAMLKLVLFNSANNNNFTIFKKVYNPKIFDLYTAEYNHTNILLTLIDNNLMNSDIEFLVFILNEIKDKIDKSYIRDTLEIAFEFVDINIIEAFIKNNLFHLFDINKPFEDFFDNKIIHREPYLAVEFIKMLEKYFDLYKSEYKFYIFLISAFNNNLRECYEYIFENYDINKISNSFMSHIINGILNSENLLLINNLDNFDFLSNKSFMNKTVNILIFEAKHNGLFYLIENFDLEEDIKIDIIKQAFLYRKKELFSVLFNILDIDWSFDNCFLLEKLMNNWKNDKTDWWLLKNFLKNDEIKSYINNDWIETNIPKSKIELIKIEHNVNIF